MWLLISAVNVPRQHSQRAGPCLRQRAEAPFTTRAQFKVCLVWLGRAVVRFVEGRGYHACVEGYPVHMQSVWGHGAGIGAGAPWQFGGGSGPLAWYEGWCWRR